MRHTTVGRGRLDQVPMNRPKVAPDRFASVVDAITASLPLLDTQADRAELLATMCSAYELWIHKNIRPGTTRSPEYDVAHTLAESTRRYWLGSLPL